MLSRMLTGHEGQLRSEVHSVNQQNLATLSRMADRREGRQNMVVVFRAVGQQKNVIEYTFPG